LNDDRLCNGWERKDKGRENNKYEKEKDEILNFNTNQSK
jgi:hypothetical protein